MVFNWEWMVVDWILEKKEKLSFVSLFLSL